MPPVTPIVSTVELSNDFLMVILPLSASTASSKFRMILSLTPKPVALSVGVEDERVGFTISSVVKLRAVVLEIPAYELLEESSKAVASINT